MKAIIYVALALATVSTASAQTHVRGYVRKDGTYVAPHVRSAPNNSTYDNYNTKGNVNPYTGQAGTQNPTPSFPTYRAPAYPSYQPPKVKTCPLGTYPC